MKLVYENAYVKIYTDIAQSTVIDIWTSQTEKMTEQEFKDTLKTWQGYLIQENLKFALTDVSHLKFTISLDLQAWIIKEITYPASQKSAFTAHAMVLPTGFMENMAIQLFTEDTSIVAVPTHYFEERNKAQEWLNQRKKQHESIHKDA